MPECEDKVEMIEGDSEMIESDGESSDDEGETNDAHKIQIRDDDNFTQKLCSENKQKRLKASNDWITARLKEVQTPYMIAFGFKARLIKFPKWNDQWEQEIQKILNNITYFELDEPENNNTPGSGIFMNWMKRRSPQDAQKITWLHLIVAENSEGEIVHGGRTIDWKQRFGFHIHDFNRLKRRIISKNRYAAYYEKFIMAMMLLQNPQTAKIKIYRMKVESEDYLPSLEYVLNEYLLNKKRAVNIDRSVPNFIPNGAKIPRRYSQYFVLCTQRYRNC